MAWAEEVAAALDPVLADGHAEYDEGFGPLTATVPSDRWAQAVTAARDELGCTFFDWLSAVDELAEGFSVVCHLARHRPGDVQHLLLRTRVPRESASLPSVVGVFAGAGWHERETTEMFGIAFEPDARLAAVTVPPTRHLLLPEEFEGHPLRKEFVLASRVVKPWPGAKEPGESDHGGSPSRRRTRPPGVPDEESWGPREPGSPAPDPLAHAQPGAARPRRGARERPERRQQRQEKPSDETTGDDKGDDQRQSGEQEKPDG